MNLLGGRGFSGACSSESEGPQQPIKVGQTSDVDRRSTEAHCRANGRIKHPSGEDDRHTRFSLDNDDLSSRSPFGAVRASLVVGSDETSARVCGKTWWQWVLLSSTAICHVIRTKGSDCGTDSGGWGWATLRVLA
jgi:hypothetical protein